MKLIEILNKYKWYTKKVMYLIYLFYLCARETSN